MGLGAPHTGSGTVALATVLVVVGCVFIHYEGLRVLTDRIAMPRYHHRKRVILLILCLLIMHVVEIWLFGGTYYLLLRYFDTGAIAGIDPLNLFDCVYYSAMVYTTIGFGDLVPTGGVRLMTGMQGVTGLVLITWSASYTFLVMQRTWNLHD